MQEAPFQRGAGATAADVAAFEEAAEPKSG